jgi:hypothetical protein
MRFPISILDRILADVAVFFIFSFSLGYDHSRTKYAMATSFHILSISLFSNEYAIWWFILCPVDSFFDLTMIYSQ